MWPAMGESELWNCSRNTRFLGIAVMAMHVQTHHRNTFQTCLVAKKKTNQGRDSRSASWDREVFNWALKYVAIFIKCKVKRYEWSQILPISRDRWVGGRGGVWIKEKHRWARVGCLGGFVLFPNMQEMVYDITENPSLCSQRFSSWVGMGRTCLCLHSWQC